MTPVFRFLHQAASKPFAWGRSDCSLFVADWVALRTGRDPAAHLRGLYDSPLSLQRLLLELGLDWINDPVGVAADCMARAGLSRTEAPGAGDVGVVSVAGQPAVSAICLADAWVAKAESGVTSVARPAVRVLAAWSVPHA